MGKPKVNLGKIEQVYDGKPVKYYRRNNGSAVLYTICCHCQLVHLEELTPRKDYIRARVWRDEEKTAWLRSKSKTKKRKRS